MFVSPITNLKMFGLRENDMVADLGSGTGFYTLEIAKLVPSGRVYAVELEKDYVELIKHKASEAKLKNVECIFGDIEKIGGTKIKNSLLDKVVLSNVFFQLGDKDLCIEEIKRILKSGGRVLFVDWSTDSSFRLPNKVAKDRAREMFERKGFALDREIDAGEHHYGMILVKV